MTLPAAGYFTDPARTNGEAKQAQDDMLDTLLSLPTSVGDVTGPSSSTSGNIATFSGTGGKTIADSGVAPGTLLRTTNNLSDLASASTARTNLGVYSTTQTDSAISTAISGISGADQVARDQIALTNMRLMLNSSVASGALYQGYQWELGTDEWATGSSSYTFTIASPNYYTNYAPAVTSYSNPGGTGARNLPVTYTGTWSNAPTTALTDGSTTGTQALTTGNAWNTYSVTFDFGAGRCFDAFRVFMDGAVNYGATKWQGSNDNVTFVDVGSQFTFQSAANAWNEMTLTGTIDTLFRYWKLVGVSTNATSGGTWWYEIDFKISSNANSVTNMTLVSPAVSASSEPSSMDAFLLWKDDSGSAVVGTDLTIDLSRDGGTTYTAATLTTVAAYDGTYSVIKARSDVSAQPSGTSMRARVKTLNNKAQRVAAPALYKE